MRSHFLGIALFAAAMLALRHELRAYSYHQIAAEFSSLSYWKLLPALALTVLNYLVLTCYDLLAFRYIGRAQAYSGIATASFTAYAFSNSIGMAALSGGSIRLRLYSAQGLSSLDIARIIGFGIGTFWLGILALGASAWLGGSGGGGSAGRLTGRIRIPGRTFNAAVPAGARRQNRAAQRRELIFVVGRKTPARLGRIIPGRQV